MGNSNFRIHFRIRMRNATLVGRYLRQGGHMGSQGATAPTHSVAIGLWIPVPITLFVAIGPACAASTDTHTTAKAISDLAVEMLS